MPLFARVGVLLLVAGLGSALLAGPVYNFDIVAQIGSTLPGMGGRTFTSVDESPFLPNNGTVIFRAVTSGGGQGIFDQYGSLDTTWSPAPNGVQFISIFDSRYMAMDSQGDVVFGATTAGGHRDGDLYNLNGDLVLSGALRDASGNLI